MSLSALLLLGAAIYDANDKERTAAILAVAAFAVAIVEKVGR